MKTVVIVCQHENWEDDAGSHDPAIAKVTDEVFLQLQEIKDVVPFEYIDGLIPNTEFISPVYPIQIDGIFNIWYSYN